MAGNAPKRSKRTFSLAALKIPKDVLALTRHPDLFALHSEVRMALESYPVYKSTSDNMATQLRQLRRMFPAAKRLAKLEAELDEVTRLRVLDMAADPFPRYATTSAAQYLAQLETAICELERGHRPGGRRTEHGRDELVADLSRIFKAHFRTDVKDPRQRQSDYTGSLTDFLRALLRANGIPCPDKNGDKPGDILALVPPDLQRI